VKPKGYFHKAQSCNAKEDAGKTPTPFVHTGCLELDFTFVAHYGRRIFPQAALEQRSRPSKRSFFHVILHPAVFLAVSKNPNPFDLLLHQVNWEQGC